MNVSFDNTYSNTYRGIDLDISGNATLVDCTTTGTLTTLNAVIDNLSVTTLANFTKIYLSSTSNDSLVTVGGVQISKNLSVSGDLSSTNAIVTGDFSANTVNLGSGTIGYLSITNNGNTLSTTTGALVVTGGIGVGRDLRVGGIAYLPNLFSNDANIGSLTGNSINVLGTISASGNISTSGYILGTALYDSGRRVATLEDLGNYIAGTNIQIVPTGIPNGVQTYSISTSLTPIFTNVTITGTTPSVGTSSGSLVVTGGVGVAGSVHAMAMFVNNLRVLTTADIMNYQLYTAGSNISISPLGVIGVVNAPTFTGLVTSSSGFDASGNRIINVASPIAPTDAVNKEYVDTVVENLGVDSLTFTLPGVPIVVCSNMEQQIYSWTIPVVASYRVLLSIRYKSAGNALLSIKRDNEVLTTTQMRCGPGEQMILSSVIPLMTVTVPNSSLSLWVSGPSSTLRHYQVTLERAQLELQPIRLIQQLQTFSLPEQITLVGKAGTEVSIASYTLSGSVAGQYRLSMSISYATQVRSQIILKVNNSVLQNVSEHLSPSDLNTVSIYEQVSVVAPGPVVVEVSVIFGMSFKSISIIELFGELRYIG